MSGIDRILGMIENQPLTSVWQGQEDFLRM